MTKINLQLKIATMLILLVLMITQLINHEPIAVYDNKFLTGKDFDFRHGGIIAGAIGMGKSTLRLHIISYLKSQGYQIIDFDYKGEITEYLSHRDHRIIPGINLKIDIFNKDMYPEADPSNYLYQLLKHHSLDLSPAQQRLLRISIDHTFRNRGTLTDLIDNILYLGYVEANVEGLQSLQTPLALLNRLTWLLDDLGKIFNTDKAKFDFSSKIDLFFDLSPLKENFSQSRVLQFIEIVLQFLIWNKKSERPVAIFIEEAQLLFNRENKDNIIAEIITTLRHKNYAVFLCGTRIDDFPLLLMDSGVIFQFRSIISYASRYFEQDQILQLAPFEFLLSSPTSFRENKHKVLKFSRYIKNTSLKTGRTIEQRSFEPYLRNIFIAVIRSQINHTKDFVKIEVVSIEDWIDIEEIELYIAPLLQSSQYYPVDIFWSFVLQNIVVFSLPHVGSITSILQKSEIIIDRLECMAKSLEEDFLIKHMS